MSHEIHTDGPLTVSIFIKPKEHLGSSVSPNSTSQMLQLSVEDILLQIIDQEEYSKVYFALDLTVFSSESPNLIIDLVNASCLLFKVLGVKTKINSSGVSLGALKDGTILVDLTTEEAEECSVVLSIVEADKKLVYVHQKGAVVHDQLSKIYSFGYSACQTIREEFEKSERENDLRE